MTACDKAPLSKRIYEAGDSHKRARKDAHKQILSVYDISSTDLENAGKELKAEYLDEMNGIMGDFLLSYTHHYEHCKSMMHKVRAENPHLKSDEVQDIGAFAGKMLNPFPDNEAIRMNLSLLRKTAHELIAIFDCIQDWILAHIPTIKDEDNSGVEVQETVVAQVAGYYKVIKGIYSEEMDYFSRRAELETSFLKQPASESWIRAIILHDAQEWDDMENCWRALIRVIMLCQNLLARNMEKLKEPRSRHRAMHI